MKHICKWTEDEDGNWHTECHGLFVFNEGTPILNDFMFCPYCGGGLEQIDFVYDDNSLLE